MTKQTWDLDSLTPGQRQLLVDLTQTNDGSMFLNEQLRTDERAIVCAHELAKLGIVDVDAPAVGEAPDVAVSLTEDGERWLLSLPEGALADTSVVAKSPPVVMSLFIVTRHLIPAMPDYIMSRRARTLETQYAVCAKDAGTAVEMVKALVEAQPHLTSLRDAEEEWSAVPSKSAIISGTGLHDPGE